VSTTLLYVSFEGVGCEWSLHLYDFRFIAWHCFIWLVESHRLALGNILVDEKVPSCESEIRQSTPTLPTHQTDVMKSNEMNRIGKLKLASSRLGADNNQCA
jgi:hypothetical protein